MKKNTRAILVTITIASAMILCMMLDVQFRYLFRISSPEQLPEVKNTSVAVVFGAGLRPDGTPSDALRDRLQVGADLYTQHKVSRVVLTGDDGGYHQDEIDSMRTYILAHGVTSTDLAVDGTGYRTYESCKGLVTMGVTHAILITQRFHLARALYLCNQLGVDSVGAIADRQYYRGMAYFWLRDLTSSVKAWWDIHIWSPKSPIE